jgi:hypothetical protein
MARTPSPGPMRPEYDRDLLPPTLRNVSPGREMRPAGLDPGLMPPEAAAQAAGRGPRPIDTAPAGLLGAQFAPGRISPHGMPAGMMYVGGDAMSASYHPSVAGSAATASDISSASRTAALTAAASAKLNGNKYPGGTTPGSPAGVNPHLAGYMGPKGLNPARVMQGRGPATDLPGSQNWGQGSGGQVWEGNLGSLPLELPSQQYRDLGMGPGVTAGSSMRPHPADVFLVEQQQQQQQQGSSSGRRWKGHYRSSSDGGGLGVINGSSSNGQYEQHRCVSLLCSPPLNRSVSCCSAACAQP